MKRSFVPLFVTNFFGTLNDNFLKGLASFIVIDWIVDPALKPVFMGAVAAALVLPFVVCSPFAPRRQVVMQIADLTAEAQAWAKLTRVEFNQKLENWYNQAGGVKV